MGPEPQLSIKCNKTQRGDLEFCIAFKFSHLISSLLSQHINKDDPVPFRVCLTTRHEHQESNSLTFPPNFRLLLCSGLRNQLFLLHLSFYLSVCPLSAAYSGLAFRASSLSRGVRTSLSSSTSFPSQLQSLQCVLGLLWVILFGRTLNTSHRRCPVQSDD